MQGDPLPLSSFRWNEVIFRSFQSGNLKQLDLEFYLGLKLPTTKRMFRFLDKRFYRRARLDFDLKTLACEHIGMSRSYAPTELKRRLRPALEELEALGVPGAAVGGGAVLLAGAGHWRIILVRGPLGRAEADGAGGVAGADAAKALVEALTARGVTAKVAAELVEAAGAERVRTKLEVFDWLVEAKDRRIGKNPAGYLVASIRADYKAPGEFRAAGERAKARAADRAAEAEAPPAEGRGPAGAGPRRAAEAEQRARWDALADPDREAIAAAVRLENPGLGRWKKMLEPLCLAEMARRLADGWVPAPAPETDPGGPLPRRDGLTRPSFLAGRHAAGYDRRRASLQPIARETRPGCRAD